MRQASNDASRKPGATNVSDTKSDKLREVGSDAPGSDRHPPSSSTGLRIARTIGDGLVDHVDLQLISDEQYEAIRIASAQGF